MLAIYILLYLHLVIFICVIETQLGGRLFNDTGCKKTVL